MIAIRGKEFIGTRQTSRLFRKSSERNPIDVTIWVNPSSVVAAFLPNLHRPRILIADIAEAADRLRIALDGKYELVETRKYNDALALIKSERLDLIIVGVHFDDSHMFELLGTVKGEMKLLDLPFICFRHLHSRWSAETDQGIRMTAELMGACKFIDDAHCLSDEEIRHAVEECIAAGHAMARAD